MRYIKIITILLLLSSCANVGNLGGGPIDDKAPILLKTNLTQDNFKDGEIILEFDEYISLNNAEKNIYLLPKHTGIKISSQNKKVKIKLDSSLRENITYNLFINGGIVDNNASNGYIQNTIFSVNKLQDSNNIRIGIPNIKEFKNIKASINNNSGRDSFKSFNTDYTIAVQSDQIIFKGIKDSVYNLWLYTDNNNDNKPDLYEAINFKECIRKDSSYILELINWKKPFSIKNTYLDKITKSLKITYDKNDNLTEISKLLKIDTSDIVLVTSEYSIIKNSYKYGDLIKDSTLEFNENIEIKNWIASSLKITKNQNHYNIEYKLPFDSRNFKENSHLNVIRRTLYTKPDTLIIRNKNTAIQDTIDLKSKSIIEEQKLSHLSLTIKDTSIQFYDIKIFKEGKFIRTIYNLNNIEEFFEPGSYKLEIYKHNYENAFNPFNMIKNTIPIYEKVLYLKASWEEKLVIKIE
jgi:hypothetical protein